MVSSRGLRRSFAGLRNRLAVQAGIADLRSDHHEVSLLIADAIGATLERALSPEEQEITVRIEALRGELNTSADIVDITDFGAGSLGTRMSGQEMGGGRVVQRQVGELCRKASKPPAWSLLLFELVRAFRPRNCIELGTCLGISAAYQAAALRLNGAGTLVTLEGAEALAGLSRLHLRELGLDNVTVVAGRFQDKLPGILRHGPPVDYAFIDGHHDEKATLEYYRLFLPALAGCAVLVFDDIAWSDGMRRAWSAIRSADGVGLSVDLGPVGLCVAGVAAPPRRAVGIPLSEAL